MTADLIQFALYFAALFIFCPPLGWYMAAVYQGKRTWLSPVFAPVEKVLYKIVGTKPESEQSWGRYALSLIGFNLTGFFILYAMMRLQNYLPLNPAGETAVAPHLAFNTAVSFITNTNWQSYGGESTMSYFTQMMGLTVQNFVSAASGMAVAVACVRGFVRRETDKIGNFWVDMVAQHVLYPAALSILAAVFFVWQGRAAEFSSLCHGDDDGRRTANHRARPGRQPGSHQAAWHQWRRLFQRQFGPPL